MPGAGLPFLKDTLIEIQGVPIRIGNYRQVGDRAGADAYLTKSADLSELKGTIRNIIDQRQVPV